ncbi:hypothetical protein DFH29DRAFT_877759 [Suillus ampliporus]|nr:hypothetical protein DFH29DRAFT_877759 [Suillus ampliporus]
MTPITDIPALMAKAKLKDHRRGLKGRENSVREEDGDAVSLEPPEIEWTEELTFQMLTEITEDEDIKQGLFPVPGLNPRNQGVPKTHWHWVLCKKLFSYHKDYKSRFEVLWDKGTPKQKEAWHMKIKNRLKWCQYQKEWSTYLFVMPTQLKINLRKIVEIEGACPYFFEMRELIGQHPNNIPVGLSNNDTDIDVSAIIRSSPDYAPGNDLGGYASEEWDIERQTPERGNNSKNVGLVPSEDGKHADGVRK